MSVAARRLLVSLLVVGALGACGERTPASRSITASSSGPATAASGPVLCGPLTVETTGRVADATADELSGLARSRSQPGVLWSHDDSGSAPVLYALRADGTELARLTVTGAQAIDWEDIASGSGAHGEPLLYIGDIGDNDRRRASIDVYRVLEPRLDGRTATAPAKRLRLRYPDGPHDAEALLVDPRRRELAIVTKQVGGARAYWTDALQPPGGEVMLTAGPPVRLALVTAGDVSADGQVVALRTYTELAAWHRRAGESLAATLSRPPCGSPTPLLEGQGEALALDARGTSFVTVTEGSPAVLRRYVPAPR